MPEQIVVQANGLLSEARSSRGVRLFAAVIGASMFMIPVPFVIHADWARPSWTLLLAAACIVAPIALGLFLLGISVTHSVSVELDATAREVRTSWRGLFFSRRRIVPFRQIERVTVIRRASSEDPDWFQLGLHVAGRRHPISLGVFASPADAEPWRARAAALLERA